MASNIQGNEQDIIETSRKFSELAGVFNAVDKALLAAITTLEVTAFMGLVGGTAIARYLESIQPHIQKIAAKCEELAGDLADVIGIDVDQAETTIESLFNS